MSHPEVTRSFTRATGGRTIVLTRPYAASPAEVWSALTRPERLARWFGAVLETLPEARSVVLDVGGIPASVQVDEWREPERLATRWTWQGEPTTRVIVALAVEEAGTRLRLEHAGLLVDSHVVGFGAGWEWALEALAAELVGERLDEAGLPAHAEVAHARWARVLAAPTG